MWDFMRSWVVGAAHRTSVVRRLKVTAGMQVENLELRQMLSASGGGSSVAAEVSVEHHGKAVPRVAGVAGEYTFFNEPGTLTVTQEGQSIHGEISSDHNPSGTFDASFKKPNSKVAKGTGSFVFDNDEFATPVRVKIKFIPLGDGTFNFNYRYKELRVS